MDESSVREALRRAMSDAEPPLGSLISSSLQAAARLRRRRRLQLASAGAAAVAVLAGGIPAAVIAGRTPATSGSSTHSTASAHASSPATAAPQPPQGFRLVRPVVPAQVHDGPYVYATGQSVGQLILDLLPHGSRVVPGSTFYAEGTVKPSACPPALVCLPMGQITVQAGGVSSRLYLDVDGRQAAPLTTCADDGEDNISCRLYQLPGRVAVQEDLEGNDTLADGRTEGVPVGGNGFMANQFWCGAAVQRAGGSEVSIEEDPIRVGGSRPGFALTEGQLVQLAADPRWGVTMSASFVRAARHLRVPGVKLAD